MLSMSKTVCRVYFRTYSHNTLYLLFTLLHEIYPGIVVFVLFKANNHSKWAIRL